MTEDELRAKHGAAMSVMADETHRQIEQEIIELIVLAVRVLPVAVMRAAIGSTLPDGARPFIQDYLYSSALSDQIREALR